MKSAGNRSLFLATALFKFAVATRVKAYRLPAETDFIFPSGLDFDGTFFLVARSTPLTGTEILRVTPRVAVGIFSSGR